MTDTPKRPKTPEGITARERSDGSWSYQVKWREGGRRGAPWSSRSLYRLADAKVYNAAVRAAGFIEPDNMQVVNGRLVVDNGAEATAGGTLNELFAEFIADKERRAKNLSDGSQQIDRNRRDWRNHLADPFGEWDPCDVEQEDVQAWVDAVEKVRAASTVHKLFYLFQEVFLFGVHNQKRWKAVTVNPCAGVTLLGVTTGQIRSVSDADWQVLISLAASRWPDVADFLVCKLGTGWRFSELAALTVGNVEDRGEGGLYVGMRQVQRSTRSGRLKMVEGQGKRPASLRTVRVPESAAAIFRRRAEGKQPGDLLFTSPKGQPIRYSNFRRRRWLPLIETAQEQGLRTVPKLHWLRHTHGTWLSQSGAVTSALRGRMGHESERTTQIYIVGNDDVPRDVLDRFDDRLARSVSPV